MLFLQWADVADSVSDGMLAVCYFQHVLLFLVYGYMNSLFTLNTFNLSATNHWNIYLMSLIFSDLDAVTALSFDDSFSGFCPQILLLMVITFLL